MYAHLHKQQSIAPFEGILYLSVWSLTGSKTILAQQKTYIAGVPVPTRLAQCSGCNIHALQISATLRIVHPATQGLILCCFLLMLDSPVTTVDVAKLELDARLAQLLAVEEEQERRHDGDDKPGQDHHGGPQPDH